MYMYHSDAYSLLHDILEYLVFAGREKPDFTTPKHWRNVTGSWKPTFLAMQTFLENSITIFLN